MIPALALFLLALAAEPAPLEVLTSIEVAAFGKDGEALPGLSVDDFTVFADQQPTPIHALELGAVPRHLVLIVDLLSTTGGERQRALSALRPFLHERLALGDRVSLGVAGQESSLVWPLLFSQDRAALDRALDQSLDYRGVPRRPPGEPDAARQWAADYQALAFTLGQIADEGRPTTVIYLGAALYAGIVAAEGVPGRREVIGGEVDASGTLQYLVEMPRAGPFSQGAREAGDQLLATAATTAVTFYPVLPTRELAAAEPWLATETGGRALPLDQLEAELARLGREWAASYRLVFGTVADQRLHRLEVKTRAAARLRHPKVFRARSADELLAAHARTALVLGNAAPAGWQSRAEGGEPGRDLATSLELAIAAAELRELRAGELELCVVLAHQGQFIARRQTLRVPTPRQDPLDLRIPLRLPAGSDALGIALRIADGGPIRAWRLQLEPPAPKNP